MEDARKPKLFGGKNYERGIFQEWQFVGSKIELDFFIDMEKPLVITGLSQSRNVMEGGKREKKLNYKRISGSLFLLRLKCSPQFSNYIVKQKWKKL